jgi:two-component sensor histidine kinase
MARRDNGAGVAIVSPQTVARSVEILPHQEASHRVANSLQILSALLSVQQRTLPEGPARDALGGAIQRVGAIAALHGQLYRSADVSQVRLDHYLRDLGVRLEESCAVPGVRRRIMVESCAIEVTSEAATLLGMIVTELVINACKHAYLPDESGDIFITVSQPFPGRLELAVRDFGKGCVPTPSSRSGLGSRIIDLLSKKLGSELSCVTGESGTRFAMQADAGALTRFQ